MARSRSLLLITATVAIATFSCIVFVQFPVLTRTDRLCKFQMRVAAPEGIAADAPLSDTGKNISSPAVLGALAAFGLLAGLIAPQSTAAFIDGVAHVKRTQAPTGQVEMEYDSTATKKNDIQSSRFSHKFGDESKLGSTKVRARFLVKMGSHSAGKENELQENARQLDWWEAACYPGFC